MNGQLGRRNFLRSLGVSSVIVPTSGALAANSDRNEARKAGIEFDVRMAQFAGGAPMNGVDDDSPAFQAAIDHCRALGARYKGGYGRINIPRGTFRIENTLDITASHGVVLEGEGDANTTLKGIGDFPILQAKDTVTDPLYRFQIGDLTIEGPGHMNVNAHGIDLGANNSCLIRDVRIWACRRGLTYENAFHTEFINLRMNGLGGLANYDGLYAKDGDPSVQENAVGVRGGRIQGCKRFGWRGESVTGSSAFGLEVLGCGSTGVYFGESPSGKDLKWFSWVGGLIDTCPDLLVVKKGVSSTAELLHFSGMWLGYANEPLPGSGSGVEFVGLRNCHFAADQLVNTECAATIRDCERISFEAKSLSLYDRQLTGAVAIMCTNTTKSTFSIGTTERAPKSPAMVAFMEQGSSDWNWVKGNFDRAVKLVGARSRFDGIAENDS